MHDKKRSPLGLYYLALLPPAPLAAKIQALKKHFATQFGADAALRSPAHLTVFPPFRLPTTLEEFFAQHLRAHLAEKDTIPFPVRLEGFGAFPPRVIFIQPEKSKPLLDLERQTKFICLRFKDLEPHRSTQRPYAPHITLAYRNLRRRDFEAAWESVANRDFQEAFTAEALHLLRHDGERWQPVRQCAFVNSSPFREGEWEQTPHSLACRGSLLPRLQIL